MRGRGCETVEGPTGVEEPRETKDVRPLGPHRVSLGSERRGVQETKA